MTSIAISKDDRYIISGNNDDVIKIWERETDRKDEKLKWKRKEVTRVVCSKDDSYVNSDSKVSSIKEESGIES